MSKSKSNIQTINKKFGPNLRKLREARKLTQPVLADKMKISKAYVSMLESGERQPTLRMIMKASEVLKVPLAEMIK